MQAFAEGLFSAFGHDPVIHIRDFGGEVQFVPGTFANASLRITVDSNSLAVANEVKEKDRLEIERTMREEVLEMTKYHEIVFESNNISVNRLAEGRYRVRVIGDLTLHGVTQKNLWISAEATVSADRLRAQGEFSLKQSDFGIKALLRSRRHYQTEERTEVFIRHGRRKKQWAVGSVKCAVGSGQCAVERRNGLLPVSSCFCTADRPLPTARYLLIMHELSIALSMIELATEEAERRGGAPVVALHLKLGPLSGVVKDALLFSYEVACNGTLLEGSRLIIEDVPVVIYCWQCRQQQHWNRFNVSVVRFAGRFRLRS